MAKVWRFCDRADGRLLLPGNARELSMISGC
jgi:hypothetical protein